MLNPGETNFSKEANINSAFLEFIVWGRPEQSRRTSITQINMPIINSKW